MHIKLADYGSAKLTSTSTETEDFQGTLSYVSPEMIARQPTGPACDIWALGIILYKLYTGDFPFEGENEDETFEMIQNSEPTFPEGVPAPVIDIIKQCLLKDPGQRYGSEGYGPYFAHDFFKGIKFDTLCIQDSVLEKPRLR